MMVEPEVVAEEFTYRDGKTEVIFVAPYPTDGPVRATDLAGRQVWMFMYAHFVFCWTEGAAQVHVSHGTLCGPRMTLWTDVKIAEPWSGPALAVFGQRWVRDYLGRFTR